MRPAAFFILTFLLVTLPLDTLARGGGGRSSGGSRSGGGGFSGGSGYSSGGYRDRDRSDYDRPYRRSSYLDYLRPSYWDPYPYSRWYDRRRSRDDLFFVLLLLGVVAKFLRGGIRSRRSSTPVAGIFGTAAGPVRQKADQTETLFRGLAKHDPRFEWETTLQAIRRAFLTLQEAWCLRDYRSMAPLVFTHLRKAHESQIGTMIRHREINKMEEVEILSIRIIHLVVDAAKNGYSFSALIEAKARDYTLDEGSGKILRGSLEIEPFEEFWTFQHDGRQWLLREIDQVDASPLLTEPNSVVLQNSTLNEEEPLMPNLDPRAKISRWIRGQGKRNPIWEENRMRNYGRTAALSYIDCLETRNLSNLSAISKAEFIRFLEETFRKSPDHKLEYRNLCTKSAEITWVSESPPAFNVTVKMHAQRVILERERVIQSDPDVQPFDLILQFNEISSPNRFVLSSVKMFKR